MATESNPVSPSPLLNETEIAKSYPDAFIPTNRSQPEHGQHDSFQLNAISMAAEQQHLRELEPYIGDGRQELLGCPEPDPSVPQLPDLGYDLFDVFDDDVSTWTDGPLFSNFIMPSQMSAPQPIPVFGPDYVPPAPVGGIAGYAGGTSKTFNDQTVETHVRIDSESTERPQKGPQASSELTMDEFDALMENLKRYEHVIPNRFQMPTRLALSRYLGAFISGFHEHMPFLHFPTMSWQTSSVHLILAVAATGAFYRFEPEEGNTLFSVSHAIVMESVRADEISSLSSTNGGGSNRSGSLGYLSSPTLHSERMVAEISETNHLQSDTGGTKEVEMMQTLLLLMAVGTWTENESMARTAIRLQGILASMVRRHGLHQNESIQHAHWEAWAQCEVSKRTKLIIFCFMNLQSLLYDTPSPIRPSDIGLFLPCNGSLFCAKNAQAFLGERQRVSSTEHSFQISFTQLLKEPNSGEVLNHSSLGNYVLIHALLQNMFYIHELSNSFPTDRALGEATYLPAMERALRNWQSGWQQNSNSSTDLKGPVAFNCIALLRIAYIRLNLASGPCRALESRDPSQIARAFLNYPRPARSPQLLRAVTHSAYALSIPVKIGLRFVAQTQAIFWSIQHSLCSLECAVLLSSWLGSIASQQLQLSSLEKNELRVVRYVQSLLEETNFGGPRRQGGPEAEVALLKRLSAGVVKIWASIFRGPQTWAIVNVIGSSLELYAQLLEAE